MIHDSKTEKVTLVLDPYPEMGSLVPQKSPSCKAKEIPYWHVNVPPSKREVECPLFLRNLSDKDIAIVSTPDEEYRILTWSEVRETVAKNRLDHFQRVPSDLRRYLKYIYHLKQNYGTAMSYMLKHRLGWEEPVIARGQSPFAEDDDVKILVNDWPYGIDKRIVHLVVWTKFELVDDERTGYLTDETGKVIDRYMDKTFGRSIPRDQIVWFRNWKSLKSIGAVEHFHVMIFDPDPEIIREVTNADKPICESF